MKITKEIEITGADDMSAESLAALLEQRAKALRAEKQKQREPQRGDVYIDYNGEHSLVFHQYAVGNEEMALWLTDYIPQYAYNTKEAKYVGTFNEVFVKIDDVLEVLRMSDRDNDTIIGALTTDSGCWPSCHRTIAQALAALSPKFAKALNIKTD